MDDKKPVWSEEDYREMATIINNRIKEGWIKYTAVYGGQGGPIRNVDGIILDLKRFYNNNNNNNNNKNYIIRNISFVLTCPVEDLLLHTTDEYLWTKSIVTWRFENGR